MVKYYSPFSDSYLETKLEDSKSYSHFPFYFYASKNNTWGDEYELEDVYTRYIKLLYEKQDCL